MTRAAATRGPISARPQRRRRHGEGSLTQL